MFLNDEQCLSGERCKGLGQTEERPWTVLGEARKQIKDSISYFEKHKSLPVTNGRGQIVDVSPAGDYEFIKIIIYEPNSLLLEQQRFLKFVYSQTVGNIHLLHIEDYVNLCKFLYTPAELAEYFHFREELYKKHKSEVNNLPEQYLLAHFFTTADTSAIHLEYIENLSRFTQGDSVFSMSGILNNFFGNMVLFEDGKPTDYYHIIQEIAKLNRSELTEFKKRFELTIENSKKSEFLMPYRFASLNTLCGYVFVAITDEKKGDWKNVLINFVDIYKYKRRLKKCLGVILYKDGPYFQMNWTIRQYDWEPNETLESEIIKDADVYQQSRLVLLPRYNSPE